MGGIHEEPYNFITLFLQEESCDAGVYAAGHSKDYFFVYHFFEKRKCFIFLLLWKIMAETVTTGGLSNL